MFPCSTSKWRPVRLHQDAAIALAAACAERHHRNGNSATGTTRAPGRVRPPAVPVWEYPRGRHGHYAPSNLTKGVPSHAFLDPPRQGAACPPGTGRPRRPARRAHQPAGLLRPGRHDLPRARPQRGRARRRYPEPAPGCRHCPCRAVRPDRSPRHAGGDALQPGRRRGYQPSQDGNALRLPQHGRRPSVLRAQGHRPVRHRVRAPRLRAGRLRADPQRDHVLRDAGCGRQPHARRRIARRRCRSRSTSRSGGTCRSIRR